MRIAIIWRYLHHYKIPFYERLGQTSGIDITVFHGGNTWAPSQTVKKISSEQSFQNVKIKTREKEIFGAICVFMTGMWKYLLKNKYDVIVSEGTFGILSNLPIALFASLRRRRFFLYVSGWDRGRIRGLPALFKKYYSRVLVRYTDGYICYGSNAKNLLTRLGVDPSLCTIVQNTIDTEEIKKRYNKYKNEASNKKKSLRLEGKTVILSVGRLIPRKRLSLLIEAFQIVKKKRNDLCLLIVGEGPERDRLVETVNKRAIPDVQFLGSIIEGVGVYFAMADLFVLPGTGGLAINEAMAYGLPVICSEADGTEKDLIIDGQTGFFFKKGDVQDLAKKILFILFSGEQCRQMGSSARRHLYSTASMSLMVENFVRAVNMNKNENK